MGALALASTVVAVPLQRRASTWSPAQGGCWSDNASGQRALDKGLGGFDDLTPAKCQSLCEVQGFNLAGVEFGRECFCGNTIIGNNQPSAGICTMACSGDATKTCGGPNALNIYVKDSFVYTTGPASPLASHNQFQNPQCWYDNVNGRILSSHPSIDIPADQMTVEKCIEGCAATGYSFAGLEFGRECYCGNASSPLAESAPLNECNMACLGDASEYCGGANRLLLYHNPTNSQTQPTPDGSWTPAQDGCWTDSAQDRALQKFIGAYNDLTPAKCQSLCENAGFNLAGVEYGHECYCGNTIMGNNHLQSGICTMQCSGGNGICGGPNAINIYVKDNYRYTVGPASVLDSHHGYSKTQCWRDLNPDRLLKQGPTSPVSSDSMTVQKCIDGCAAAGFSYAGVEYGRECFCDDMTSLPSQSQEMSECNMPCTGDATESCGGPDRILIYYKPATTIYTGAIEVRDANTDAFLGYISRETTWGMSTYSGDLSKADAFTFTAPTDGTVTQAEIVSLTKIDEYPFLGLIEGPGNDDDTIGSENWQYLVIGGTPHSEPDATPQTGPNSYSDLDRTWESSVWTINTLTGDISPQWVNPDGSKPATFIMAWYGTYLFGSGDPAQMNDHYEGSAPNVKLRFNANPDISLEPDPEAAFNLLASNTSQF
ncbi:hypothetical protein FRC20_003734 [Serendipita sp. 405]|nr:hypothetical protein FRC20_003734 [Serendipita sp. 405]